MGKPQMIGAVYRAIRHRLRSVTFRGLVAALVLMFLCASAQAETRVALVMGNGDYKHTSRLANPRNDATDVAAALTRAGFETITGLDLDKAGMEEAEIRFARKARDADVAIFYYSGHAIQYAGTNYLLPVDALIKDSTDLRRLAKVDEIVDDLRQAKTLRVLILDSCRDNPLADELKRALGSSRGASVQRGLARLDGPHGMIVAYSTQAGQTADDGTGRNSPYTAALLQQIETPEEISTVFRRTAAEVARSGRQLPELSLSFFGDFYPKGPANADVPPKSEPATRPPTSESALQPPTSAPGSPPPISEPAAPVKEARLPDPSDPLDLVTDCDRLASNPNDPQRPRGVAGVDISKIDIVPALAACDSAMAQHPEIARFAFQAGIIRDARHDYAGARPLFEKAASMGSVAAMNSIGELYLAGAVGVTQDQAKARKWFEKGAAAGSTGAMENLGHMYLFGYGVPIDLSAAKRWFEQAAASGEPEVLASLGWVYLYTTTGMMDYAEARKWSQRAADAGSEEGMSQLGDIYRDGLGVDSDAIEAKKWYEKAAAAGSADAMVRLGKLYETGNGISKDRAAARKWYGMAATAGNQSAKERLASMDAEDSKANAEPTKKQPQGRRK
jgi:TPR repeat protein